MEFINQFQPYLSVLGDIMMAIGSFVILTGAVGILRMPDFYSRIHPAGMGDALGAPLLILGLAIKFGISLMTLKLLLLILFIYVTSPTATHAIAKAAMMNEVVPLIKHKTKKSKK